MGNLPGHSSSEQPLFPPLLREVWFFGQAALHQNPERDFQWEAYQVPDSRPDPRHMLTRQDRTSSHMFSRCSCGAGKCCPSDSTRAGWEAMAGRQWSAASSHVLAQTQLPHPQNG